MPYGSAEKRKEYHRNYMRAYYHRRRHEERVLLGRRNTVGDTRRLPAPTRPCPDKCEICGGTQEQALSLDHCHETGVFRGWLCNACNLILGRAGDNLDGVERWTASALRYLKGI